MENKKEIKKTDSIDLVFTEEDEHCLNMSKKIPSKTSGKHEFVTGPEGDIYNTNSSIYNAKEINEGYNKERPHSD